MIAYHGTPIGGPGADVPRFLDRRDALVPFTYPTDAGVAFAVCRSVVLDNGAFTVWRQGGQLDVPGYLEWVRGYAGHPRLAYAIIPDVIDGTEQQNDDLIERWPHDLRRVGCPVWHLHESLYRLERMAMEWPIVALGSSGAYAVPNSPEWWGRMNEAMESVCDSNGRPRVRLHGLRMLDKEIVSKLPLYAADSTNAAQNGQRYADRHGLKPVQGRQILADRIESIRSADAYRPVRKVAQTCLFNADYGFETAGAR